MMIYTRNEPVGRPEYYSCFHKGDGHFVGIIEQDAQGTFMFRASINAFNTWYSEPLADIAQKLVSLNTKVDIQPQENHD